MGRSAPIPLQLQGCLEALFGAEVRQVRVIEHSWFARLHLRAIATTRRGRIYLRGSAADFFADPALVLHEYCHVLKQWQPGRLTTWRYIVECLNRGYWDNRFEVEARDFTRDHLHRFRVLLASSEQRLTVVKTAGNRSQKSA